MNLKNLLFFISLFYLILYIPLSFTIYCENWYEFNYEKQNTYEFLSEEFALNQTKNLIGYFSHKNELNNNWLENEKKHLEEVRNIYDFLFLLMVFAIIGTALFAKKKLVKKYVSINVVLIFLLILILPFFVYFWDFIFHPIIFNNNFWIIEKKSLFYYLFPYDFFRNSLIFIISVSLIENLIIYLRN